MDKLPTEEQIKKFWNYFLMRTKRGWKDGRGNCWIDETPAIDLNNLFKYAVPKLRKSVALTLAWDEDLQYWECIIFDIGKDIHITKDADTSTLALFWAIWEVIHAK